MRPADDDFLGPVFALIDALTADGYSIAGDLPLDPREPGDIGTPYLTDDTIQGHAIGDWTVDQILADLAPHT